MDEYLAHEHHVKCLIFERETFEHIACCEGDVGRRAAFFLRGKGLCLLNDFEGEVDPCDRTFGYVFSKAGSDCSGAASKIQDVKIGLQVWEQEGGFGFSGAACVVGSDGLVPSLACGRLDGYMIRN